MTWIAVLIVFAIFALAVRYATDSRDGQDWAARDTGGRTVGDMVSSGC